MSNNEDRTKILEDAAPDVASADGHSPKVPFSKTYDFMIIFDCKNGNPNGDPDLDNMPRRNIMDSIGIISDVCLKRKIRDYVGLRHAGEKGFGIFIQRGENLETMTYEAAGGEGAFKKAVKEAKKKDSTRTEKEALLELMKDCYWDVRAFGGVFTRMSEAKVPSKITGAVILQMSESADPLTIDRMAITRCCQANISLKEEHGENGTFGGRWYIPYGLYTCAGQIRNALAEKSGFTQDDAEALWDAIEHMFDNSGAAGRGLMTVRKLIVFEHESRWGSRPSADLFGSVKIERITGESEEPRSYRDYKITVPEADRFPGVKITVKSFTDEG